jgi:signal peptidase I
VPIEQEEFLISAPMSAVSDPVDCTKCELAAEVLHSYGELRIRVTGTSMLPAIWPGDILSIRRCGAGEVGLGEIAIFTRHGRLFAHRLVAQSGLRVVTRGDGRDEPDPPVTGAEIVGRVTEIVRRGKSFRPAVTLSLGGRVAAALFRRSASAGRLFTRLHALPRRIHP